MSQAEKPSRRTFLQRTGACLALLGTAAPPLRAASNSDSTIPAGNWASGGTGAIGKGYPDPFADGLGAVCDVPFPRTTKGPCYSPSPVREDISAGRDGLPTRLCLKVVNSDCEPVSGAEVDIWHCDTEGIYSGEGMPAARFCTGGNNEYLKRNDFRGITTSDSQGNAWFSTCFPGWYPGRAVHIHFMVTVNGRTTITSQLGFDDALVDGILDTQPAYAHRGKPDTHNRDDGIFPSRGFDAFAMHTARMPDGVLLAWKTLMLS